ncbi:MAG: glycosyltransferase family 4 protein, partial [Ktedonobacterales bacterium]
LRHGFDVIHVANPPDIFFLLGLFYRPLGVKFVFDQHDLAPELFKVLFNDHGNRLVMRLLGNILLLFERWSYRTANLVIVTNASYGRIAMRRGKCPVDKVSIVRNGPDAQMMQPSQPEPELKMGRRYLLAYVGVMSPQDGVEYALYALHSLVHARGRKDVSLVLMGDGVSAKNLRTLAHDLQLDDYVTFTGWTQPKDIVRYLATADIGLSPDPSNELNEVSTMIKTMEYMAMGKPVVAFDLTETRFSAQEAGLYAIPNVVEDFANKIEELLDNEDMRRKMGMLARKRIEEALSWDRSKEQLLLAYAKLLHECSDQLDADVDAPGMASALLTESSVPN